MDPYEPPISRQLIKGNYVEESTGNRQTHLDVLNNDHVIKHKTQQPSQAIDGIAAEKDIISRSVRIKRKFYALNKVRINQLKRDKYNENKNEINRKRREIRAANNAIKSTKELINCTKIEIPPKYKADNIDLKAGLLSIAKKPKRRERRAANNAIEITKELITRKKKGIPPKYKAHTKDLKAGLLLSVAKKRKQIEGLAANNAIKTTKELINCPKIETPPQYKADNKDLLGGPSSITKQRIQKIIRGRKFYSANKVRLNHSKRDNYNEKKDEINRKRRERRAANNSIKTTKKMINCTEIQTTTQDNDTNKLKGRRSPNAKKMVGKKNCISDDLKLVAQSLVEMGREHNVPKQKTNHVVQDKLIVTHPSLLLASIGFSDYKCSIICGSTIYSTNDFDNIHDHPPVSQYILEKGTALNEPMRKTNHVVEDKLIASNPLVLLASIGFSDYKCSIMCGSSIYSINDFDNLPDHPPMTNNVVIDVDENNDDYVLMGDDEVIDVDDNNDDYVLMGDYEVTNNCTAMYIKNNHNDNLFYDLIHSQLQQHHGRYMGRFSASIRLGRQFTTPANNVISKWVKDEIVLVTVHDALMQPCIASESWTLLEQLTWTPTSTKVEDTQIPKTIAISKKGFDTMVPPYWLNDDALDFMIAYLFRGKSNLDTEFSYMPCSFFNQLLIHGTPPKKRSKNKANLLARDLIFVPINIRSVHWVLAVIVKPSSLLSPDKTSQACILYVDSRQPHLDPDPATQNNARIDRTLFHDKLLTWLNYELTSIGQDCRFNATNCQLLFGSDKNGKCKQSSP